MNDRRAPVAVICATDWELVHLLRSLPPDHDEWLGPRRVHRMELRGAPLVLAACGMGMVSAAAGTEAIITRYAPGALLNYGCAGAHRADLLPGDVVVSTAVVAYDSSREAPDGAVQYGGMRYLIDGAQRRTESLPTDTRLRETASRAARQLGEGHEPWPADLGWPTAVAHRAPRVWFGGVASADRWNRSPATIAQLAARHETLCEDMEAAAIGLVCASHRVPFLSIKDISNNELHRATVDGQRMLQELGADQVARRAAAFTRAVLEQLVTDERVSPS